MKNFSWKTNTWYHMNGTISFEDFKMIYFSICNAAIPIYLYILIYFVWILLRKIEIYIIDLSQAIWELRSRGCQRE